MRYFSYSVARYVHDRREERLNLGVVVYDREQGEILPVFSRHAAKRIKALYREVDGPGLALYLSDLQKTLPRDPRILEALPAGSALNVLEDLWRNVVQFSPERIYRAPSAQIAAAQLMSKFVDSTVSIARIRSASSVDRARTRTEEAIRRVLGLERGQMGFGYTRFEEKLEVTGRHGSGVVPVRFEFQLYENFLVDVLSFEHAGEAEATRAADLFIRKVEKVRRLSPSYRPHLTVAVDQQRTEESGMLLDYIQQHAELPERAVAPADEAERVIQYIREQRQAA